MFNLRSLAAKVLPIAILAVLCFSSAAFAAAEGEALLINPNTASVDTLSQLPGMNTDLARSIVVFREMMGDMQSTDDLLDVDGFTPELLEKIQPYISIDPMATDCGC